jgi:hypothetical protein
MNAHAPIEFLEQVLATVTPLWAVQPTSRDEWEPIARALKDCERLHQEHQDMASLHSWLEQQHGSDFAEETCSALELLLENVADFAKLVREDEFEGDSTDAETAHAVALYGAFASEAGDVFDRLLTAFHKIRRTDKPIEEDSA